jgi:purine operon repressor
MRKLNRAERLIQMMRTLMDRPGEQISLGLFAEQFGAAKSSISEDLHLIKETLEIDGSGLLITHAGAAGGVQYWPTPSPTEGEQTISELLAVISDPIRIMPGGFLYMTDILTDPRWCHRIGGMLAGRFRREKPDLVLTVEVSGIPLAVMVAQTLGVPLVVARREGRPTQGPAFVTHYVTSSRRVQSMAVGLRAIPRGARVLIIDDFMKAGATARGMIDMVTELGALIAGVGVFIATDEPARKRVEEYVSLLTLETVNEEERTIRLRSAWEPEYKEMTPE